MQKVTPPPKTMDKNFVPKNMGAFNMWDKTDIVAYDHHEREKNCQSVVPNFGPDVV